MVDIAEETSEQTDDILQSLEGFKTRINRVVFTDLNKTLLSAGEDGFVRRWDLEVRLMLALGRHNGTILAMCESPSGCFQLKAL